jgi:hypothetical protein
MSGQQVRGSYELDPLGGAADDPASIDPGGCVMPSRLFTRALVGTLAAALLAVSCSSGSKNEFQRSPEGTGDAGLTTSSATTAAVPTPEPPTTAPTPPSPGSTSGPTSGGGGDGGNGIFLIEGGTYQITSDRMIYIANQKFTVASPKLWFGSAPSSKFPKGAFLATDTGAFLSTGGTWTNASSRDLKDHLRPVRGTAVLRALAKLPISTWHYRSEAARVRHLGPMAEDFFRLFHLGQDDRHIATVDEEGVALAAIRALAARSGRQQRQIDSLRSELDRLEAQMRRLAGRGAGGR